MIKTLVAIFAVVLNPFFWIDLYAFLTEDEDDSFDLTDAPESEEYMKAQANEYTSWEIRQRAKGRLK